MFLPLALALAGKIIEIRDVWANNLDEEMACIREIIQKYNYVAMVRGIKLTLLLV